MKVRTKTLRLTSFFLLFSLMTAHRSFASPVLVLSAQGGAIFSHTSIPNLSPATQPGSKFDFSITLESHDVYNVDATRRPAFFGRFQIEFFKLGNSNPQLDGNLFRAWQGIGPTLFFGVRTPAFRFPLLDALASAYIETGGGIRTTKYTGTGLVSANPTISAQIGLDFAITERIYLGFAFPFEYAWKAGGFAFIFGMSAVARFQWKYVKKALQ
ncbi:MAG: hypothetical protein Q8O15_08890 [Rectinemataceae bacterium]|nr:hypothetical protein [Rectinemataceae bacterium]